MAICDENGGSAGKAGSEGLSSGSIASHDFKRDQHVLQANGACRGISLWMGIIASAHATALH